MQEFLHHDCLTSFTLNISLSEAYEVWPVLSIGSKLANLLDSGCLDSSSSSLFWHTVSRNTRIVDKINEQSLERVLCCRLAPAVLSYLSGLINKLVQTRTLPCVSTLRVPRLNDIPPFAFSCFEHFLPATRPPSPRPTSLSCCISHLLQEQRLVEFSLALHHC